MSKGRVWNKGKRNGGGGPAEGSKELARAKALKKMGGMPAQANPEDGSLDNSDASVKEPNPIDRVVRMNRENWVVRPARVKPEKHE